MLYNASLGILGPVAQAVRIKTNNREMIFFILFSPLLNEAYTAYFHNPRLFSRLPLVSPEFFHVFEGKTSIAKPIALLDYLRIRKTPIPHRSGARPANERSF
jgi:hypothetical protein